VVELFSSIEFSNSFEFTTSLINDLSSLKIGVTLLLVVLSLVGFLVLGIFIWFELSNEYSFLFFLLLLLFFLIIIIIIPSNKSIPTAAINIHFNELLLLLLSDFSLLYNNTVESFNFLL